MKIISVYNNSMRFVATISLLVALLLPAKSYALVTIEDVIKNHKLDLSKDEDRCSLPFLIEHDYADVFSGGQVEYYDTIIGDYSKNNDSGITFRVFLDKKRHVRTASFADSDRFYILKLKNGQLIGSHDGYFVPFDEFGFSGKNFKLNGHFAVLQKTPPKDKIKYFYVNECKVQIFNNNN